MGTTTKKKNKTKIDCARDNYDTRIRKILEDAVTVAEIAYSEARQMMESGVRKGILNQLDIGQRAIGEMVRLRDLLGDANDVHQNHYTIEFLEPPSDA